MPTTAAFETAPRPRWVTGFDLEPHAPSADAQSPASVLLVDHQLFPKTGKHYLRHARRINSPTDRGELAQIGFDPATEHLSIHSVRIWREGTPEEVGATGAFDLVEREPRRGGDRAIAQLRLDGIQPGDVIDIAATRTAIPIVPPSPFHRVLPATFTTPVARWSVSMITRDGSPSRWQASSDIADPDLRQLKGGWTLTRWSACDLPATTPETNTPCWHLDTGAIEISEFASWTEVARNTAERWGKPQPPDALRKIADGIAIETSESDHAGRAERALAFVRAEIRDVDHGDRLPPRPTAPERVLQDRAGSPQDKALLLCQLLELLDIPALPVLVNATSRHSIGEILPTPAAFDHALVRAQVAGEEHWIDPSARRPLDSGIATSTPTCDFGFGLPLSATSNGLVPTPPTPADATLLVVRETFTIGQPGQPTSLHIERETTGADADTLRQHLAENGMKKHRQGREEQLRKTYPGARASGDWSCDEPPGTSVLTLREKFLIENFAPVGEGKTRIATFTPDSISDLFPTTPAAGRKAPWALPFPCRIRHEITFELPLALAAKSEHTEISTTAFGFNSQIDTGGERATALFRYWSKSDHVAAEHLDELREKLDAMAKATSHAIDLAPQQRRPRSQEQKPLETENSEHRVAHTEPPRVNRKTVAAVAIGAALIGWAAFGMLSRKNDTPPRRVAERSSRPLPELGSTMPAPGADEFLQKSPGLDRLGDSFDLDFAAKPDKDTTFDGSLLDQTDPEEDKPRGIQKIDDREPLDFKLRP